MRIYVIVFYENMIYIYWGGRAGRGGERTTIFKIQNYYRMHESGGKSFKVNSSSEPGNDDEILHNRSCWLRAIIAKETVRCVIISTYRLSLQTLHRDYPQLVGAQAEIPSFILHGDNISVDERGEAYRVEVKYVTKPTANDEDTTESEGEETEKKKTDPEEITRQKETFRLPLPSIANIAEVAPQSPRHLHAGRLRRRSCLGVHHAKYMLVFTESGIYVSITTSNLSQSTSVDLSWTQFFPRGVACSASNDFGSVLQNFLEHQSDQVIERQVIERQDRSRPALDLMAWLDTRAGLKGVALRDFYDFNAAAVDLITTVPGQDCTQISEGEIQEIYKSPETRSRNTVSGCCDDCKTRSQRLRQPLHTWTGRTVVKDSSNPGAGSRTPTFSSFTGDAEAYRAHMDSENFANRIDADRVVNPRYGCERLKEVLEKRQGFLLPRELSALDLVTFQPTAISTGISMQYMQYLLRCLKPRDEFDPHAFNSFRLLWPSQGYIDGINASNDSSRGAGGGLFLRGSSLQEIPIDVHDSMYTYKENLSVCSLLTENTGPHVKSYARLLSSSLSESKSSSNSQCTCQDLVWFLLTSACLSKG